MLGFGDSAPAPGNGFDRESVGVAPASKVSVNRKGVFVNEICRMPIYTGMML